MALSQSFFSTTELLLAATIFCIVFWAVTASRTQVPKGLKSPPEPARGPGEAEPEIHLEQHVSEQARRLVGELRRQVTLQGHFEPAGQLVGSVASVIGAMCFGKNFPHSSEEMLSIVASGSDFVESASSGSAVDFFPALRYLPNPALARFKKFNEKFVLFLQKTVQEHYRDFDRNSIQDITGALFKHSEKNSEDNGGLIPQEKIINIVNDLFGAGFETVTTALTWSLMLLVTKPEVQRKIHQELDTVIGWDRQPRLLDRVQLPYLERTSLIHLDCNSFQLIVPQQVWGDPGTFRPERFLTGDISINKALSEKVMLSGMGKRRCLGETPAKWEVFLFLAILLHQLEFSVPPGESVDLTPCYGLVMKPARRGRLRAHLRFSA
uniref:cytochrome P450 1A2-like n=1 Tax=Jaculus jaculus TaxID=51337 RepID=UPI001E1AF9E5|nr:cytochrome P450 1A2-like [Jaculus jaculus]